VLPVLNLQYQSKGKVRIPRPKKEKNHYKATVECGNNRELTVKKPEKDQRLLQKINFYVTQGVGFGKIL